MAVAAFTLPFRNTSAFYTGTGQTSLVPSLYPVAINGRPYMIDQKSGEFQRGYEPRVRDSQDISTAPGEAAINPGGLWRRGHDSWHLGAGQQYADVAESQDYRFYKSKGIDPWTKGQISLLNKTKLSLSSAATSSHMLVQDGRVYVSLNGDVKFSTDPFASSPTWTDCTGEPGGTCAAMATDGYKIYLAFPSDGVRQIVPNTSPSVISTSKFVNSTDSYYMLGFAKQFMFGAHDHKLRSINSGGSPADVVVPADAEFRWVGVATGQNAAYAAGYSGKKSLVYKVTIKADGTLDSGVVALELPTSEVVTAISGYLGFILLGTSKGVRFCSTDSNSNLVAGPLIPTSGSVYKFSSDDRFSYFTWTNYDGVSGGLGRLDLSTFTGTNTPAYATDLMYDSTADVKNVVIYNDKAVFTVSGVGVVAEDTSSLVASGNIEMGTYRWGIPDRKFVARVDVRAEPLTGSVTAYLANDHSDYDDLGTWSQAADTENTYTGTDTKTIEADFKLVLTRSATVTSGPIVTRWMARAYAAPFRSQTFSVPVLLHSKIKLRNGKEVYLDVQEEQDALDELLASPRIILLQIGTATHSVIVEDIRWIPFDTHGNKWEWDGTAVVIMRSVEN
jgi:hypothetical protein